MNRKNAEQNSPSGTFGYSANPLNAKVDRRTFLKSSFALAGAIGVTSMFEPILGAYAQLSPVYSIPGANPVDTDANVNIVRSICLMCHGGCGIQGLVDGNGRLVKIDGNPYHPNTLDPHLPYETDPSTAERGRICAKGQAGIETLYSPIRIKHPLKRVGPRGSGEWQVISWEQAFTEIIEGGDLFGEGDVEGLRAIRDLETPIDPNAPELGPKANQFVFCSGRIEHGRKEFGDRFAKTGFGTINYRHEHTSICELSHHVAYGLAFGGKHHFKPDALNSKYLIFFGTTPLEANFPMVPLARKLMQFKKNGGKLVIVDPRFSNSAAKADVWVPVKPGADAALALGMVQWIIDNKAYDANFLGNTTQEAANKNGESTWTNATYLVRLDDMTLLNAKDAGLGGSEDDFVVAVNGEPAIYNSVDQADLEADLTVNNIPCKSAFTLLAERAREKTISQYAEICGLDANLIVQLANDFSSYGKQAVADFYRGPVQHTNGVYTALAIIALNLLVGNINWKGGLVVGGGHWHEMGGKSGNLYDLSKLNPNAVSPSGVAVSREKAKYENSTEFKNNGYPAKRPWFPLTNNLWQELFAGIADGYPYPIKALMLNMANPAYSMPATNQLVIDTLKDTNKVPLFIAIDRVMSETAKLADYILPDVSYLERYSTSHVAPTILTKTSGFRQPMVDKVFPDTKLTEEILIEIAKRMNLPGFGDDGFGPGMPLNTPEDWYLKAAANIASEGDGVPGATEAEKVAYIRARGGRFENAEEAYDGNQVKHKYTKIASLYVEKLAKTKDSMTGQPFDGLPKYEPIKDAMGAQIQDAEYPFQLVTHKLVYHTQSRTGGENLLLLGILPQNYVEINAADAQQLGIATGDIVRVSSASNKEGVTGYARVTEGIRPGVVNIPHSYGHWEYGSKAWKVDGESTEVDKRRGAGVAGNLVMRIDDSIGSVGLQDLIGGSASFYDTWVKVEKA
ncbi:MAG: molybdopterin-dependent oxidoreductase [Candidatus Poribacteria bacterium]